jgi:hypothetical protein
MDTPDAITMTVEKEDGNIYSLPARLYDFRRLAEVFSIKVDRDRGVETSFEAFQHLLFKPIDPKGFSFRTASANDEDIQQEIWSNSTFTFMCDEAEI